MKDNIIRAIDKLLEWALCGIALSLPVSKTGIEVCATIAIVLWIVKKVILFKAEPLLPSTGLNAPVLAFYAICFLSIFWSTHPAASGRAFLTKTTEYILIFFIVADRVSERKVLKNILICFVISASVVSLNGIYQKFVGTDLIRGYPLHSLERVTSSFKFPNGLSVWLLMVTMPAAAIAFFYKGGRGSKIASIAFFALLSLTFFFGYTRAALIVSVPSIFLVLFMLGSKNARIALVAVTLLAALVIAIIPYDVKNSTYIYSLSRSTSYDHRVRIVKTGWNMFIDRPITGQGLNTFMANYERFRVPEERGIWYAHNSYLQVACETGVFGLAAFLWLIFQTIFIGFVSWRRISEGLLRCLYVGLFGGICSYLLMSSVEVTHYMLQLAVLFYFALGLFVAIKKMGSENGKV